MYFAKHAFLPVILIGSGSSEHIRRLIIDGVVDNLNSDPFGVAILQCLAPTSGTPFYQCGVHCSGSLIGPNVVLTAAHCVHDIGLPYNDTSLYVDFSTLYALVGSTDYDVADWSSRSRLVSVKSAEYHSYGDNLRFESDGDIALLELDDCVSVIPDQIEFATVATRDTETPGGECISVSVTGYGLISNAPAEINDGDGIRRHIVDKLHSFETCRDSYIAAAYGWTTADQGIPDQVTKYTVIPENFLCTGGTSIGSVCYGDSGGPTSYSVSTGSAVKQILSVTSFGIGNYCTTSADYSTRVSSYTDWIHTVLTTKFAQCPGRDVVDSFASFPLPAASTPSVEWTASRCPADQWQCPSGACIDKSRVCDGTLDCADRADENSTYCSSSRRLLESSDLQNELAGLLANKQADVDSFRARILNKPEFTVLASVEIKQIATPSVFIAGVLRTAGKKARHSVKNLSSSSTSPKSGPTDVTCSTALTAVNNGIIEAKDMDTRDDQWNAAPLEAQCHDLQECSGTQPSGFSDATNFCYDLLSFLSWNETLVDYAPNFGPRFNASCPGDLASSDVPSTASTTKAAVHLTMFLAVLSLF